MEFSFSANHNNNNAKKKGNGLNTKSKTRNTLGRRAHHNALEQKRRGVIRGCFESLRKSVPTLHSEEKKLSRSGILRETAKYIKTTKERLAGCQADIEELRLQNEMLSNELERLESQPNETPHLYKEFDGFTKICMNDKQQIYSNQCFETAQTGESTATNMFSENYMKDRHQNFVCSTGISLIERNSLEERGYLDSNSLHQEWEILNQKIFDEEDFQVDVEGFVENPFSLYRLS